MCRRREVGEVEGETAGDEMSRVVRRRGCRGQHITSVGIQNGYIRIGVTRKCKMETLPRSFAYSLATDLQSVQSEIGSKGKEQAAANCGS